jgi:hemerythrin-like domain-containing protein
MSIGRSPRLTVVKAAIRNIVDACSRNRLMFIREIDSGVKVRTNAHISNVAPMNDPIPDNLLREPVEFLFADHVRQRVLCDWLKMFAEDGGAGADFPFADALAYLETDHANHLADESDDLFPRLRAHMPQDGEVTRLLDELDLEHRRDLALGREIACVLRQLSEDGDKSLLDEIRLSITAFVSGITSHLLIEDERVLPLARTSLTDKDFEEMGRAMARRRGIDYPD